MFRLFLSIIFSNIVFSLYAQDLSLNYLGNNIWNPGINIEYSQKIKKLTHSLELSAYKDPGSHSATFILYGIKRQRQKWSLGLQPLGIYRSFLPKTYTVTDDGKISNAQNYKGNFYFSPALNFSVNLSRSLHIKTQVLLLYPYNFYIMPVVNFGFGYRFIIRKNEK